MGEGMITFLCVFSVCFFVCLFLFFVSCVESCGNVLQSILPVHVDDRVRMEKYSMYEVTTDMKYLLFCFQQVAFLIKKECRHTFPSVGSPYIIVYYI